MANRFNNRKNMNNSGGNRRFNNYDRPRYNVNPWQGGMMPNSGGIGPSSSTEATIALANNLITNFLTRQNPMPSLLDINVRQNYGGPHYRDDRFGNKIGRNMQMGPQMNRRVASGGRIDRPMNKVRRPMRPNNVNKPKSVQKNNQEKKETSEIKANDAITESENADTSIKKEFEPTPENADASTNDTSKADDANETGEKNTDSPKKIEPMKTEYEGILSEFLECHICEKKMWDGRSFDNHIKGRVHNIMMDKTKQSYHMTADAMRQELKINEMKRNKRTYVPGGKRAFCPMCDMYVYHASAHRRSPGHQKLKKYLHPSCNTCRKEFPTRIEFDEHRLTAPHMRLCQEKQKDVQSRPKPEVVVISTLQDELSQVRNKHDSKQKKNEAKNETKDEMKDDEAENTDETSAKQEDEEMKGESVETEKVEEPQEETFLLLDYKEGDDLADFKRENLPRYQCDRSVGPSFITEFSCKHCSLCKKYFDTDETAEVHLRTWKHFHAYIQLLYLKGNFKPPAVENAKRKGEEVECEDDLKRRKTDEEIMAENADESDLANGEDHLMDQSMDQSADESKNLDVSVDSEVKEQMETDQVANQIQEPTNDNERQNNKGPRAVRGRGRGRGGKGRRGARF